MTLTVVFHRLLVSDTLQLGTLHGCLCAVAKHDGDVLSVRVDCCNNSILTSRQNQLLTRRHAHGSLCIVNTCLHVFLTDALDVGFTLLCGRNITNFQYACVRCRVYHPTLTCCRVVDNDTFVTCGWVNHRTICHHLHISFNDIHFLVVSIAVGLFQRS